MMSLRFDGHKAALAADPQRHRITAVAVLPGNAHDHERALDLVEQMEANRAVQVTETIGACAAGDSETRRAFADAGRPLGAKVPQRRGQAQFPKDEFQIDLDTMTCGCPGGQATRARVSISVQALPAGPQHRTLAPAFPCRGAREVSQPGLPSCLMGERHS
jgi:hypothetical protein